jgi:hypothetical protein
MSAPDELGRLRESGDLHSLLRGALDAERADADVDAARLLRIEARIAERVAPVANPQPGTGADPGRALRWFGGKGPWVLLGAAALVGAAALSQLGGGATATVDAPRAPSAVVASPEPATPATPDDTETTPVLRPDDLPAAPPARAPSAARRGAAPGDPASTSEGEEIALLARAHEALPANPEESLALCREHERAFPGGHFAQEREAVAIEALVYARRTAEAERRWAAFQNRYPASSHRRHLESLFATGAPAR